MKDIRNLDVQTIYNMIKTDTISLEDLTQYITEVNPNIEKTEIVKEFLEVANTFIDHKIKNNITKNAYIQEIKTDVEPEKQNPSIDEKVPLISEEAKVIEYPYFDDDNNTFEAAKKTMDETYNYCEQAGMTINDISLAGRNGRGPYITFEINNESKQMLDNIMNEFYQNNDGVSLEFLRSSTTRMEFFTLEIDPNNMSREEFYNHVKETFQRLYHTVETTKKDYDYEESMPDGLKGIKDRFRNDDPDIGQDFTIGYVRNDGKDSYYIVADDYEKAIDYARSIGYDIKNTQGAKVFEIETNGSIIDTKLEQASIDLSYDKSIQDINEFGISDLDIYGALGKDPRLEVIENFIETSNDPHLMCVLEISIPPENHNQRVVRLIDEAGVDEVLVFTDGSQFDNKIMPKIIDTYKNNNDVSKENINISGSNSVDRVSCEIESANNTTLKIDGYTENEVNMMTNNIENEKEEEQVNVNAKQKTIGTYPTNQTEENSAFVSMPVLFVICVLFILMIILLVFAN